MVEYGCEVKGWVLSAGVSTMETASVGVLLRETGRRDICG